MITWLNTHMRVLVRWGTLAQLAVSALLAVPAAALAHHSFAMFDGAKQISVTGTVRAFQFTNPHCFLQILVGKPGSVEEWSIEMTNPANLLRNGWTRSTVKPGEMITVVMHPLRAGGKGGSFMSATTANGKPL